jgi:hypothetical protein
MSDRAAQWNAEHPIGTAVILTRDNGREQHCETRSPAFTPTGVGEPVIFLTGVTGWYLLSRVRPARVVAQADGATA